MSDGDVVIKIDLDSKNFDAQIEDAEEELEKLEKAYNDTAKMPLFAGQQEDLRYLRTQIEKTTNRLIDLKNAKDRAEEDDSDEPEKKINLLESLTKGVKKLAFGILGIRTAYSIIRKASSSYLATDEHTTKQLEANWTALGTFMETIITAVSNLMKKLVTSILYFASVLTGVNYIEKANTAILKKQTKATQGLANANDKLKASFDEIETLGNNASGIGSNVDTSVLFDVADIGENAKATIERIGEALKPVYDIIKQIVDYAIQHPNVILLTLGGVALLSMITKIIGVAGVGAMAGTGLAGVASLLAYLAGIGVIAIEISILYSTVKEARDAVKLLNDETDRWLDGVIALDDQAIKILKANKDTPQFIDMLSNRIESHVDELIEDTHQIEENRKQMSLWEMIISAVTGDWDADTNKIIANYEATKKDMEAWTEAYEQGKLTDEQKKRYIETLKKYKKYLEEQTNEENKHSSQLRAKKGVYEDAQKELAKTNKLLEENDEKTTKATKSTKENTKQVNEYNNALGKVKTSITTKFNVDTTGAKNSINTLFDKLKTGILNTFGITFPTIRLAKGGIVNQPGRGVSLGSAIGGEKGAEWVQPLTDSQSLDMVADAIGKRVTINATIPVYAYNRVVDRKIEKIKAENNFATNK